VQVSRIQLSFGIVPLQETDSSYDVSTGLVVQPFSIIFFFFSDGVFPYFISGATFLIFFSD
jgi:hypothetical protein